MVKEPLICIQKESLNHFKVKLTLNNEKFNIKMKFKREKKKHSKMERYQQKGSFSVTLTLHIETKSVLEFIFNQLIALHATCDT